MWLSNEGYALELRSWIDDHKDEFITYVGEDVEDCEFKLSFYGLHSQYLSIFESQITLFVERKTDYTIEEFFNECRMAMEGFMCAIFEEHEEKWFVDALMSAIDFKEWFKMMVGAAGSAGRK